MIKKIFSFMMLATLFLTTQSFANERTVALPEVDMIGGKPLMQALAERKSTRDFTDELVSEQDLSNLLWAAWGINRDDGHRTIPTAMNDQAVKVYLAMQGFLWIYDAENNAIHKLIPADFSAVSFSPLLIIYTAEGDMESDRFGNLHAGSMYQNVGLYAASAGLGNVVLDTGVDVVQQTLAPYLPSGYTVRILQSVGIPAE